MLFNQSFEKSLSKIYHDVITRRPSLQHPSVINSQLDQIVLLRERISNPRRETIRALNALSRLPLTEYSLLENSRQQKFITGITKPIFYLHEDYSYQGPGCLGKYMIAVPWEGIIHEQISRFHFIPINHIHSPNRHFHHCLDEQIKRTDDPLDEIPTTCWGSFGTPILQALFMVEIAVIFEYACLFLSLVNMESVLCHPIHSSKISLAEYAAALGVSEEDAFKLLYGNIDDIIF